MAFGQYVFSYILPVPVTVHRFCRGNYFFVLISSRGPETRGTAELEILVLQVVRIFASRADAVPGIKAVYIDMNAGTDYEECHGSA